MKKTLLVTVYLFIFLVPIAIYAQGGTGGGGMGTGGTGGGGMPVGNDSVTIDNPLGSINSIEGFLLAILDILLVFAVPLIVFFIILAGFKYVTAGGNELKITEANRALLYALVGGLLILGAYVLIEIIQGTVDAIRK